MSIIKLKLLNMVAGNVASCTKCELHKGRTNSVFHRGYINSKLMFAGEGPGKDEDQQGLPFVGRAGKLLDNMIRSINFEPEDVYIANIVKCRPPGNRKPFQEEVDTCIDFLHLQIALVQPKIIVALGNTAIQGLCGFGEGITKRREKWEDYSYDGLTIPVAPTFHPAALLRNPKLKEDAWYDLQKVKDFLNEYE